MNADMDRHSKHDDVQHENTVQHGNIVRDRRDKGDAEIEIVPVGYPYKQHDAVFGEIDGEHGPNYRNVGWMGSCVLMMKANVGLGVLSIPYVYQVLGIAPGTIVIILIQAMVTWSDWVVGCFKLNHPEVYGLADVGFVLFGKVGREVLATSFTIYMIFVCGSGLVSISTALNAVSIHATCTAVFIVVAAAVGWGLCSIRTMGQITWLGWIGMVSIMAGILAMTVAVGVQDRPSDAPKTGPWDRDLKAVGSPTFADAISAVASVIFAASATPTYFGIISEMRDARDFNKSMFSAQLFVTVTYVVIGLVVYCFCGQYVSYPALGSAGPLMKRVSYGLAIPGLFVTLTIYSHLPAKYVFVRILRGSKHLTSNSLVHWATWLGCTFTCMATAYIIASAIPIFSSLVSFIGAVFCPTMCMIPYGLMWWHDNWRLKNTPATWRRYSGMAIASFVTVAGIFLTVAGTYGAIVALINQPSEGKPWSCADNSNSV
ncbi:unnamed protein product [Cutaneotrichosporon oleaginosum]